MLIDCDSCAMRDLACGDCVVTVMLGMPSVHGDQGGSQAGGESSATTRIELDGPERAAIAVLAGQGLVPPLRLVPKGEPGELPQSDTTGTAPGGSSKSRPSTGGTGVKRGAEQYEIGMLPGAETA